MEDAGIAAAPLTPKDQGVKQQEHPVQSCEADSARAERAAVAARRAEVPCRASRPAAGAENFGPWQRARTRRARPPRTQRRTGSGRTAGRAAIVDAFRRLHSRRGEYRLCSSGSP